ncbi:MAG: mechanosensitive ion channel family protein, partial [Muribaculaceae bacterium]
MKNYLLRIVIVLNALMMTVTAQGVLKEKNFQQTLNVLRAELEQNYLKQKVIMAMYEQRAQAQHDQLILTMQKCNQISLILYSQKEGFTFDMAYACQQATDIYKNTNMSTVPYDKARQMMRSEIERYDMLITSLEELPPSLKMQALKKQKKSLRRNRKLDEDTTRINMMLERLDSIALANGEDPFVLNESEEESRNECIIYAKALRNNLARLMNKMDKDVKHYEKISQKVEELNNYALKKYESLRQNIFNNRGDNYIQLLMKLPMSISYYNKEIKDKYSAFGGHKKTKQGFIQDNSSQWRGKIIPLTSLFIFVYVFISSVLSYVIIRWLLPNKIRSRESFKKKEPVLLVACGFIIFMISVSIIKSFLFNNFLIMSVGLLLEF